MPTFFKRTQKTDVTFGPPYAVLNLSKVGLRYFRLFINISPSSKEQLVAHLMKHPNVGWVLASEGWFNLGVGLWARDNAEINDISSQLREMLGSGGKIIYQSELTSLYSFGTKSTRKPSMPIVDSTHTIVELTPIELDYIKLITLDSSMSGKELAAILAVTEGDIQAMGKRLRDCGVIVGSQERVNYGALYYKVFADTSSKVEDLSLDAFLQGLWKDPNCIYVERANGKYDLEFEVVLDSKAELKKYTALFGEFQTVHLTDNLYTNLYPLSKTANLLEIQDTLRTQTGKNIDFRNSKLWYLNYRGAEAYLNIYDNKEYFEVMEKGELDLFDEIAAYVKENRSEKNFTVIDIGSGNGMKGRTFIERMGEDSVKAYYPVDIQPIELAAALKANTAGAYAKHPTLLPFENLRARFPLQLLPGEGQIYVFFGGTYGNFPAATINSYLKPVVSSGGQLLIAMPIIVEAKSESEIIASYSNIKIEDTAFGPLAQMGFEKADFEQSPISEGLYMHVAMEEQRLVTFFILKNDTTRLDRTFEKGTVFTFTTSWKPTLAQFTEALETDFTVERMFTNKSMAIALVKAK